MKETVIVYACIISFLLGCAQSASHRPTVLWHGMGDTCCYPFSMGHIKKLIEENLPGTYVYSIEVGDSIPDDEYNSYFMNVNKQVDFVCNKLKNDINLSKGFNAMGFSQGGQFLRAYIQRCNNPPVYNFISVGGQHQGVYGLPKCPGNNSVFCERMRDMLNIGAYDKYVQETLVQAEYWQDPFNRKEYLGKCVFLPDINNEYPTKNVTYKKNFMSLNQLVLVLFTEDSVVQSRESEWFGFYVEGQDHIVQGVENTTLYTQDWIGLKYLVDTKRVQFISTVGDHLEFSDQWFNQTLIPFLNN